jgi:hypothetical protein
MVGFVAEHVAQHFRAARPWPRPTVSVKRFDAAAGAVERLSIWFMRSLAAKSRAAVWPTGVSVLGWRMGASRRSYRSSPLRRRVPQFKGPGPLSRLEAAIWRSTMAESLAVRAWR